MRNTQLSTQMKVVNANIPTATGTALASTVVDGTGFSRCMYVLSTGAAGTGATLDMKITESATSGGSYADITSAALVQLADTGGSKLYTISVPVNPAKPFQQTVLTAAVGTFACVCTAYLFRGVAYPVDTAYATQAVIL